jgi:hypothetical protein
LHLVESMETVNFKKFMVNSIQATNYGRERLKALGLTHEDGFTYTLDGDIDIQYRTLLGDRQYYYKISSRKTYSECPDEFLNRAPFKATRRAPHKISNGRKYNRPAGTTARTYIPYRTIELFKQGCSIKTAIFTEGEIKTAYSNKHYLNDAAMFGFSGISCYTLCNEIKTALKLNVFKNLVINYDADATRADNKTRLAQFFSSAANFYNELKTFYTLQNEALPRIFICIQNSDTYKGIDDILQAYGNQAADAFNTFQNSEYFSFSELTADDSHECLTKFFNYNTGRKNDNEAIFLKAPYYSNKTENVRTRFTSILKDNDITGPKFYGKVYNVATGTGKTTAVIQAAKHSKIIFFAPLNAIIKQVYNDALKQGIDAAMFNGNTKYRQNVQGIIERVSQVKKQKTLFTDDLPQLIICTFQSSKKLHNLLDKHSKEYHIIIDEFHTLASSNYINKPANDILSITANYKSITGLTGTPIDISHPTIKKMPRVNVKLTGAPLTPAHFISAADTLQAAAQIFIKAHNEGRRSTVYFNDTKEGLQDFLLLIGNTPANVFNSITKGNFDEFLNTGLLSKEGGIIATDSYALGLNNLDERQCDVIILGKHHPANIKQFKERERISKCNLYIVQAKQPKKENNSPYLDKNELIEQTKQQLKSLKKRPSSYIDAIRNALQFMHILETPAGLDINYLSIDNFIFKQQTNYFNSSPYKLLKELSNYGFAGFTDNKLNFETDNIKRGDDFKTASKMRRQQNKAVKHELFCDAANVLQAADDAKITALNKAAECTDDSEFYSMFIDIRKLCSTDQQALELFKLSEGNRAKVKQIILRLTVKKANFNSHELGNAPAAILRTFAHGQELTADDLRKNFIDCLQTDATINTAEYRDATINYVLKKLRIFFDVKLYGKEKTKYKVSNLANCFF